MNNTHEAKHLTIAKDLASMIVHGFLRPGDHIPTTMTLVHEYQCSPGTVARAISWLKAQEIVYTASTIGRFVTEDAPQICKEKGYR